MIGKGVSFHEESLLEGLTRRLGRYVPAGRGRRWAKASHDWLLELASGWHGVICTAPGGEIVRLAARYRHVTWNLDEYWAFRCVVRPGGVVLDIGAHVGCYALLFGQWVGATGQVFAFEPSPECFDGLRRNVTLNQLADRVTPVAAAIADRNGILPLSRTGPAGTHRLLRRQQAGSVAVPTVTIDRFCSGAGIVPDLIKVDAEGYERRVLKGARATIEQGGGIDLFVELHPSIWPTIGESRTRLEGELDRQGLRPVPLDDAMPVWETEGVCVRLLRAKNAASALT